jgi:hypothetical protein
MQYGEFRGGYDKDREDTRLVFYGIRYLVENYVSRRWTLEDIEKAAKFHKCAAGLSGSQTSCSGNALHRL